MNTIDLKSVVWRENDYYISQCLEVDISSFGKTRKESLDMFQDALELYFQDAPLPSESKIRQPLLASITLEQHA